MKRVLAPERIVAHSEPTAEHAMQAPTVRPNAHLPGLRPSQVPTTGAVQRALADRSPGQQLAAGPREELAAEARTDLGSVRVHTDHRAAALAADVQADAFTRGDDIYFATGKYAPATAAGRRLLRHEVGHVLQHRKGELAEHAGGLVPANHSSERHATSGEAFSDSRRGAVGRRTPVQPSIARQVQSTNRDARQEALLAAQSAAFAEPTFGIGAQDSVWSTLGGLWMKDLLQVLNALGLPGVEALGRHVDVSRGGFAPRLRLAIDAARMKLSGTQDAHIDSAFVARLETLPDDQRKEISEFLLGPLPQGRPVVIPPPPVSRSEGRSVSHQPAQVVRLTRQRPAPPLGEALPEPRTSFEAHAFKRWEFFARIGRPEKFQIVKDPRSGGIIGFLSDEGAGGVWVYDIRGKPTMVREKPLETPILSPLDFIPFELLGSLTAEAASVVGRGVLESVGKTAIKEVTEAEAEVTVKALTDEAAAKLGKEAELVAGTDPVKQTVKPPGSNAPAVPITPPELRLPPHTPRIRTPPFAGNVASYGESVVEEEVLENFLPRARQMSAKAEGFDAFEDAKYVSVGATRAKDGTLVVEESISGGNWIQIKGVSRADPQLIEDGIHTAMEKAAHALKRLRANLFERTGEGFAYRTVYAGDPDKFTIFLKLEQGAVTPELVKAAEYAIAQSGYKGELPSVFFVIAGH